MIPISTEFQRIDKSLTDWARERRDRPDSLKCAIAAMMSRKAGEVHDGPLEMSELSLAIETIYSGPAISPMDKSIVTLSYVKRLPVPQIERRLSMNKTRFHELRKRTWSYFRGRLHEIGFSAV